MSEPVRKPSVRLFRRDLRDHVERIQSDLTDAAWAISVVCYPDHEIRVLASDRVTTLEMLGALKYVEDDLLHGECCWS